MTATCSFDIEYILTEKNKKKNKKKTKKKKNATTKIKAVLFKQ